MTSYTAVHKEYLRLVFGISVPWCIQVVLINQAAGCTSTCPKLSCVCLWVHSYVLLYNHIHCSVSWLWPKTLASAVPGRSTVQSTVQSTVHSTVHSTVQSTVQSPGFALTPEEVWQGQKVINGMITCLYKPNGNHTWGFFTAVPQAFIIVIYSLDSPDNILTNNALYPWCTSVGKDKHGLSTCI